MTSRRSPSEELADRCAASGYDPRKALNEAMDELQPTDDECAVMLLQLLQIRARQLEG